MDTSPGTDMINAAVRMIGRSYVKAAVAYQGSATDITVCSLR
jgi:hypothetical protein